MNFVPCSVKHKSCSPAHAAMVRSYRDERARQEQLFEDEFGAYDGDEKHAKATGTKLINFKDWLKANKKSKYQHEQEKADERPLIQSGKRQADAWKRTNQCPSAHRSAEIVMESAAGTMCSFTVCASRSWPIGVTRCQRRQQFVPDKAG